MDFSLSKLASSMLFAPSIPLPLRVQPQPCDPPSISANSPHTELVPGPSNTPLLPRKPGRQLHLATAHLDRQVVNP